MNTPGSGKRTLGHVTDTESYSVAPPGSWSRSVLVSTGPSLPTRPGRNGGVGHNGSGSLRSVPFFRTESSPTFLTLSSSQSRSRLT